MDANKLIENYLQHFEKRASYYWGKNRLLYERYAELLMLLRDLKCHIENNNLER